MTNPSDRHPHPGTGQEFPSPVPPGSGWPADPAREDTPVARTPAQVRRLAAPRSLSGARRAALAELEARTSVCSACPRLVAWREQVATDKRASFAGQPYWGRPIPGWGDPEPQILVVGLAPAAHGGNRTGRVFTGDSSGDWLFASLHRTGLASRAESVDAADGQVLHGVRMVATVRCAPPQNRPTPRERDTCAPWLDTELALVLPTVRVVVALGSYGWDASLRALRSQGYDVPTPKPRFGHRAEAALSAPSDRTDPSAPALSLLGSYHPSQHNTFTGRLTQPMLDAVFLRARELLSPPAAQDGPTRP